MGKGILSLLVVLCVLVSPVHLPDATDSGGRGDPDSVAYPVDGGGAGAPPAAPGIADPLPGLDGTFTENLGQVADPDVRFYASGGPLSVGLMPDGLVYTVRVRASVGPDDARMDREGDVFSFTLAFGGCNDVSPRGVGALGHRSNFFIGTDPKGWATGVRSFSEVLYEGVYDGIDLRFHLRDGGLKYDFLLDAGADPAAIVLRYEGVPGLWIDPGTGDLVIPTPLGELRDPRPIVLQDRPEGPWSGPGSFAPIGGGSFAFSLPEGVLGDLPLVIDPGLEYATLLGGSGLDQVREVVVGDDGSVYVAGYSASADFPVTHGANNTASDASWGNAFVGRFDATLSTLQFATYIGGSSFDTANIMELAPDGGIYVVGYTNGPFPVTPDALTSAPMGDFDIFLCKLSSDGSSLLYSTLLGGSGRDSSFGLRLGPGDDLFIAGPTSSDDIPCTTGAFCSTYEGQPGAAEAALFAMRMDPSSWQVEYCTYVNGIGPTQGTGMPKIGLCVDAEGNALLCGAALRTLPTTPGTVHPDYRGGPTDGFVLELDATGSRLLRSTFLGGSGTDEVNDVKLSSNGTIYVTGSTNSNDLDTTPNAPFTTRAGLSDMLVCALDRDLGALEFCSYQGGRGDDGAADTALGPDGGHLFIVGTTYSQTLPCTPGCYDPHLDGPCDCALVALNLTSMDFDYCTYLGGSNYDVEFFEGLAACPDGRVCFGGDTYSSDFPTTPGAFDRTFGGEEDGFVVLLDPTACDVPGPPRDLVAVADDGTVNLSWAPHTNVGYLVLEVRVYRGETPDALSPLATVPATRNWTVDNGVVNGKRYHYAVAAVNSAGEGVQNRTSARPLALPTEPTALSATTGNGTVELTWSPPADAGGELLGYTMLRGTTNDSLSPIATDLVEARYEDRGVAVGTTYWYAVVAFNSRGTGPATGAVEVKATSLPSPPRHFSALAGDLCTDLAWDPPESDGGSPVLGYRIYRASTDVAMSFIAERGPGTFAYTDHVRGNGERYLYQVTCRTDVGESLPTPTLEAVPFGLPGAPRSLVATAGDGTVTLTWAPPLDANGRPVYGYVIHYGESPGHLPLSNRTGNVTTFVHTGLTNGVTYYYEVASVNLAGEGLLRTETVAATPMGLPGAVEDLAGKCLPGVIQLTWRGPADMGGAASLTYALERGTSGDALGLIATLVDQWQYMDYEISPGATYYYRVVVSSEVGEGPASPVISLRVLAPPGGVQSLVARPGNGCVELTWSPPESDGGSEVTGYVILRGLEEYDLSELDRVGPVGTFNDSGLVNGVTLYYIVRAQNQIGTGPVPDVVNATPRSPPGPPTLLWFELKDGSVVLRWEPPTGQGMSPVLGYLVMRGTTPNGLETIAELGPTLTYADAGVEAGRTYYYCIVATSAMGRGAASPALEVATPPTRGGTDGLTGLLPLVLAIVIVAVVVGATVVALRRGRGGAGPATGTESGSPPQGDADGQQAPNGPTDHGATAKPSDRPEGPGR